ncbi:epoxide hydrolase, soluble (sEH) [Coemansia biformis]|uniref:Epoxide hydrolase, soluble (SEH) n=1 Tax=Coemansia biformis TaxID=1286918 RepID=A0A9W7YAQ0_9FUNG|nr:epoxide hydrolase, soluble (sEH) [Coemansia biformis]
MEQVQSIPVNHEDFIHDIAYNFYGTRLATCSSDKCIKIWDWNKQSGLWILNESIQAHDSSVVRLSWAHPEFGQVLASCSLDRTVRIWAEQETSMPNSGSRWRALTTFPDSTAAVHSVAFAPEYTGLSVAAASSDGKVRLYSPAEPVHLDGWSLNHQIEFVPGGATDTDGPLCVSWCKARFSSPRMLVVGGSKHNRIKIFQLVSTGFLEMADVDQYDSNVLDVDWAPSMGRSYHLIATATADGRIRIYKFWSDPSLAETHLADSLFVREGDDLEDGDAGLDPALLGDDNEDGLSADDDDDDEDDEDDEDDDDDDEDEDDEDDDDENDDDGGSGDGADASGGDSRDGIEDDGADSEPNRSVASGTQSVGGDVSRGGAGRSKRSRNHRRAQVGRSDAMAMAPWSELVAELSVQPSVPIRRVRWNGAGTLLTSSSDDGVLRTWKATVKGTWREIMAIATEKRAAEL